MIERIILNRLRAVLALYVEDPRRYEKLLIDRKISADEAARARASFTEHPPSVIMGYARQGSQFPAIAVVLGQDANVDDYIGEDAPMLGEDEETEETDGLDYYTDEDGQILDPHMRRWEVRVDLYLYAEHPDTTLYLYYLTKQMCVGSRTYWHTQQFEDVTYSGAELAPDQRYLPTDMWTRRFSMTLRHHEYYTDEASEDLVGPFSEVTGIVVDDGEMPASALTETEKREVEEMTRLVVPYQAEESDE